MRNFIKFLTKYLFSINNLRETPEALNYLIINNLSKRSKLSRKCAKFEEKGKDYIKNHDFGKKNKTKGFDTHKIE